MISKLKYEHLLFLIAVIWVLFFSYVLQLKPYFSAVGDDVSYLYSAKLLYFNSKIDNNRPLLISALHGLPFLFGFSSAIVIKWGFVINFTAWFFTDILLFKLITGKFNRKIGFIFSVLFLFFIGNLSIAFNFLSESIFIFLILLSLYFIDKFYSTHNHYFVTLAISVMLLNSLIKPVSIGLAFILILVFLSKFRRVFINKYTIILFSTFGLVFFQMYALKKNYGDFTLSYISSLTYYNYLGDKADCYKKDTLFLPFESKRAKEFVLHSSHEMKKIAEEDFKNQISNNTCNLFKAYLFCIYSNSSKGSYIVSEAKNKMETVYFDLFYYSFKAISKLQNIIFTILAVGLSFYYLLQIRREKYFALISIFILYIFFISAMSCFQCDRFHIAFFPLLLLLVVKFISDKAKLIFEPLQK